MFASQQRRCDDILPDHMVNRHCNLLIFVYSKVFICRFSIGKAPLHA